jgi:hypothetical protein
MDDAMSQIMAILWNKERGENVKKVKTAREMSLGTWLVFIFAASPKQAHQASQVWAYVGVSRPLA